MGKDLKGKEIGKGISQRLDKRYIARFTNKYAERKTFYDFKLSVVKKWLNDSKYEDQHGINGDGKSITLNEWYITWTDLYKKKTVKSTTIYKNDSYYNARIKPMLGSILLKDIKVVNVQKLLNDLLSEGLSHGTVSNIRFLLNGMFEKAFDNEYIRKNPCDGLELPRAQKREKRVLTVMEQKIFFDFATNYTHINVLKFAITTGCRIGEILGLKWDDIDFDKRIISINRTIHYSKASSPTEGSKFFFTTPKTQDSIRILPMLDEVYDLLKGQRLKQLNGKMLKSNVWKQNKGFENLVFTSADGKPVNYYNVNDTIKVIVEKINIVEVALSKEENRESIKFKTFTCHCLRHSYATRCYENNISTKVVQKLLGHSNTIMTDFYTHVTDVKQLTELSKLRILA